MTRGYSVWFEFVLEGEVVKQPNHYSGTGVKSSRLICQ